MKKVSGINRKGWVGPVNPTNYDPSEGVLASAAAKHYKKLKIVKLKPPVRDEVETKILSDINRGSEVGIDSIFCEDALSSGTLVRKP